MNPYQSAYQAFAGKPPLVTCRRCAGYYTVTKCLQGSDIEYPCPACDGEGVVEANHEWATGNRPGDRRYE